MHTLWLLWNLYEKGMWGNIINSDPLNQLYFYKYRINLEAKEGTSLPLYQGSALRGAFGKALKQAVCITRKASRCDECVLEHKCVYSSIMETPLPEGHPDHRKYKNAPHPYLIIPSRTPKRFYKPGDPFSFDIVLIGKANEYLPYFIFAFTEMGKIGLGKDRGTFEVVSVEAVNAEGVRVEVFREGRLIAPTENKIGFISFEKRGESGDTITLFFETPVRIKVENRLAPAIPFQLLIQRLSERAFLLAHFHCGADLGDFGEFARDAEPVRTMSNKLRWMDWERYSNRQQTKMKFGGWVGEITYQGDFQKYIPLLRFGEHIHVGKATTFGLGKYRVVGL